MFARGYVVGNLEIFVSLAGSFPYSDNTLDRDSRFSDNKNVNVDEENVESCILWIILSV